jgi:hypothetical protein
MAIEILKYGAIANQCRELAALLTRHTDGKGNGAHKTDMKSVTNSFSVLRISLKSIKVINWS